MLRREVDSNARREVEGINIDGGSQQTLHTENLWLNVIITHSKFIASPFICLFSTIISPSFAILYRDDIVVTTVPKNASFYIDDDRKLHPINLPLDKQQTPCEIRNYI